MEANNSNPPTEDKASSPHLREIVQRAQEGLRHLPAWAKANPGRAAIGGIVAVGLPTLLISLSWYLASLREIGGDEINLQAALEALDNGELTRARGIADQLLDNETLPIDELGGPPYVIGMVYVHQAHDIWNEEGRLRYYEQASHRLEEARDRGFPLGREDEGIYHLATSLFNGERYIRAAPVLMEAVSLQKEPGTIAELTRMISLAYVRQPNPRLEDALIWNEKFLELPGLTESQHHQAWLEQSRIQLRLGHVEQAREALAPIPESAQLYPQALVVSGQMLISEAVAIREGNEPPDLELRETLSRETLQQALSMLREAESRDTLGNFASQRAMYLAGVALHHLGDLPAALEKLKRTEQLHDGSPEALAAIVEQADVLRELGEDQEAVKAYRELLATLPAVDTFVNPWLSLDDIYQRVEEAFDYYYEIRHYDEAFQLAQTLYPRARSVTSDVQREDLRRERIRSVKMQALTQKAWAEHIMSDADAGTLAEADSLRQQGRDKYRNAGSRYARLAQLRFVDPEYPNDIWLAADNYRRGHDFQHAMVFYEKYLTNITREQRATAMLGLGESQLALEQVDEAINTLRECIASYPLDPVSYQARLLCSRAHREVGQPELARALLEDNLDALTPQSFEWRDSLFELATTLYEDGLIKLAGARSTGLSSDDALRRREALPELEQSYALFQESINRFEDAVRRYPDAPQFIVARYHLAESHRFSSRLPDEYRRNVAIESTQNRYRVEAEQHLENALLEYVRIQETLISMEDEQELTLVGQSILRNCYFARGTVLYQLRRYEEAIRAFGSASSRYQREPVALEAQVRIASCHHQLGQPVDAKGSIEHAILILDRIPEGADFAKTTRYSRKEWSDLLNWMSNS